MLRSKYFVKGVEKYTHVVPCAFYRLDVLVIVESDNFIPQRHLTVIDLSFDWCWLERWSRDDKPANCQ